MAKTIKKQTKPKSTSSVVAKPSPSKERTENENHENAVVRRLSQQFNLLLILIVGLFLFQTYTYFRVNKLSKGAVTSGTEQGEGESSRLSLDSILTYADELDMDVKTFESCLTDGEKVDAVNADVAQAGELGVRGTPGFFVNGKLLAGAFPFEFFKEVIDAELAGTGSSNCESYSEELQQYCSTPENQAFYPEPVAVDIANAPFKGSENAPVTIVEFSDFECPYCQRAIPTVKQIEEAYKDQVKLVYKQLPLVQIHPNAQRAAEASLCAHEQGKFWEMHDKLFGI